MANEMSEVVKQQLAGQRGENRSADARQAGDGKLASLVPRTAENSIKGRRLFPCASLFFCAQIGTGFNQRGKRPMRVFVVQDLLTLLELSRYRYRIPIKSGRTGAVEQYLAA
jgi:hypothetical protein